MSNERDNISKEIVRYCMDVNGFTGQEVVSTYKVADWYLKKSKEWNDQCENCGYKVDFPGMICVKVKSAEEFMNKYGNFWVGTNIKLVEEIKEKLCQLKKQRS